jgi:hypothetical protein
VRGVKVGNHEVDVGGGYNLHYDENLVVVTMEKDTSFAEIPEIARKIKHLSQ